MGAELSRNLFGDLGKDTLEQLDLLLMQEVRARKVRRDGIHFQGLHLLQLLENEVSTMAVSYSQFKISPYLAQSVFILPLLFHPKTLSSP